MELNVQTRIERAIATVIEAAGWPAGDFVVDYPTDKNAPADLFSNVAMVHFNSATKADGERFASSRELAEFFQAELAGTVEGVADITVAGPGFLNFSLDRHYFTAVVETALAAGRQWGANDSWAGKKVIVEYTDPNPFKEFHIGHLFTNAVGESIARLFMMNGANTKRVNYQGDVGLHVACAIWGLQRHYGTEQANSHATNGYHYAPDQLGVAYKDGASYYKTDDEAVKEEIRRINRAVYERTDEAINEIYDHGRSSSLLYFEEIYQLLGTKFDEYFFESEAGPKGKELVIENPDIFPESEGARVFQGEQYGLHTRVFSNAEGLPTYEAKELALAKMKEERLGEYDHSVISTSNEITEYFKVLKKAMSFVYPDLAKKTEHIGHGTVRLASGKMSSRTGDVIRAVDFINEIASAAKERILENRPELQGESEKLWEMCESIALGAVKYVTLKGSILQDSVFDKERALSFEGDSGPYLQYTYARINSVVEKAAAAGVEASTQPVPPTAHTVEKLVERFPSVIEAALAERAPHQVTGYLTELAGAYNSFYASERIADPADEFASYRVALSQAVALTLERGLWTLGIKAPERM